jgi:hypothetical protein
MDMVITNIVGLEERHNELADQLHSAEMKLRNELIHVVRQVAKGKLVSPAVTLVLARHDLPDVDLMD